MELAQKKPKKISLAQKTKMGFVQFKHVNHKGLNRLYVNFMTFI